MYLKGSKWHMKKQRRRRRSNPLVIILLLLLVGAAIVFNQFVVPSIPVPLVPTATATRDPEAIINEARAYFEEGNLQRSIETYKLAVLVDVSRANTYIELARVQILVGEYEAAQTSAQNALLLSPDNPRALALLGWAMSFLGKTVEAEEALLRAIEIEPDNAEAHAYYAELLADEANYELAGEHSRLAMELAPNSLEVRRARAYVLELTANYEDAVLEYQAALAINDSIADLHLSLGRTYFALQLYEDAINEFVQANALNPTDPLPDAYTARVYLTTGEFGKAVQAAEKAAEEDPGNPRRYGNLGVALYKNLQYAEAISVFALAIQGGITEDGTVVNGLPLDYDFDIIQYYSMYGLALAYSDRCGEAVPIFQLILATVPDDEIGTFNAEEGIRICEENVANPATPTPTPEQNGN